MGWTAAGLLFYTVLGFLILPLLVRVVAVRQLSKLLDRPVTIQKVRLNPYTLTATVRGLWIKDKDGEPLVSWDEAQVNFQLASLFGKAWVFKEIRLSQPFVRVQINRDYTLNVSDIVARCSKSAAAGKFRAFRIKRVRLIDAKVAFTDLTPRMPFRRIIGPLELTLTNFRTDSDSKNHYAFSGITDGGERLTWKGFFYLDPLRSEGEFSVDGISLVNYAPLYQDLVRFEIQDGLIDVHSGYRYEKSAATHLLAVTNTTLALKSLKVADKGTGQTVVEVSRFVVSGASADTMARTAEADAVTVADGRLVLCRNKDSSVHAVELSQPAESAPHTPGGIILLLRAMTNVVAMWLNTTNLSAGAIRDLQVTNCALHLEDWMNSQPVRLDLEGIAVNAKNISNRAVTNMTAEVSMRWDTNGTIRAAIEAGLSPPTAEVKLAFDQLNLRPLASYLEPHLNIFVLGSKLGLSGTVHLRSTQDAVPEVRFRGDVWLDEFSTAEGSETENLLKWNTLRISGMEANLSPPVVSAAEVRVEDVFARLVIETNRTLNLMSALRRGGTNAPAPWAVTNAAAAAVRAKVFIGSVAVTNANVHFIDRCFQPNVNIMLEQLHGTVGGLSSDDPERAVVHLQGTVGQTASAEVTGRINPWNQKQPTELKVALNQMNLLPAAAYSAKYLGYELNKGTLNLDLSYHLAERTLKSQNHITLDQLTLGRKVESPDATELPIRLAIALLKDRNGRIELEVPIDGNLDDPDFHLSQVISGVMRRMFTRIVTSPFSALSALFGGKGEELGFLEFDPGSTNLVPATIEKLDALVKGLYERPELRLQIEGNADARTDLDALRAEKSERATQPYGPTSLAERADSHSLTNVAAETQSAATNTPVASRSWKAVWSRMFTSVDPRRRRPGSAEKGATALMRMIEPVNPEPVTRSDHEGTPRLGTVDITPAELQALALERARNVKAYLLATGKVEGERVSLTEFKSGTALKDNRVYLRLQ